MKILIVSDSHGDTVLLKRVIEKHKDVDIILHAGDSELPPYMLNDVLTVKGNCDYFDYPSFRNLHIEGHNIHIEHGNRIKISDLMFLENNDYDIVIFGHTHILKFLKLEDINKYLFNPVSLLKPRDSDKGSYIVLEITKNSVDFKFYRIDLN